MMDRRAFIAIVGGSILVAPLAAEVQPPEKIPRIGFLAVGSREGFRTLLIEGLLQGLRERGYIEGRNIVIEYRFSEHRNDRLPALAAELVALKVKLIVASGTPASFAAKQATSTIPIVMGPSPPTRSRPVWSLAWHAQAATSPE
jgi:putative tryptophan/tyrosine transport system substrate-binding protein